MLYSVSIYTYYALLVEGLFWHVKIKKINSTVATSTSIMDIKRMK